MYVSRIEKLLSTYSPVPLCIISSQGKISRANAKISEVFIYDGIQDADLFALTGIKYTTLVEATEEGKPLTISRNEKVFNIKSSFIGQGETAFIAMYFFDITEHEDLKKRYKNERVCMALVNVDNFDELTSASGEENQIVVASEIDKMIRLWSTKMYASITRYKEHLYFLSFEYAQYEELIRTKFSILDEVREIETDTDFPVTLSIGVGLAGESLAEIEQYATDALDLALGRGGDQAVVKAGNKISYFGGKTQAVEKRNKGKSRVIAHALKQLIDQSSNVMIMGHKNPDMDSFGSAIGIYKVASSLNKEAHIIINEYNDALSIIYEAAKATDEYSFINSEKAVSMSNDGTLVVVVDTHRPSLVDCPELLSQDRKVIVIDHHRKAEESIESPILTYMEPYASSASELVTEIVQYSGGKKTLSKMDAEALLAGITIDTNRFAVKTGVRTFEAASWLRRSGADTATVKRYFQTDMDSFKIRARCIANAEFIEGNIAMSVCQGQNANAQIVNSQVADELLTVQGIQASFVAGTDDQGQTVVSARSLGDINVQIVMERIGGGGHLNTAGAQVDTSPEETLEQLKEILKEFR